MTPVSLRQEALEPAQTRIFDPAVRALQQQDIPRVAAIFLKVFRKSNAPPSSALMDYLEGLYLGCPWHDPACGSRVHVDNDGVVNGFLGITLLNMEWEGQPLRAGVMGGFMVEDRLENRGVGMKMLRDFLQSPLDVFFSDTANLISLSIAQKLRFQILQSQSLEWVKVLRPAGFGVNLLARRLSWMPEQPLAWGGRGIDRAFFSRFQVNKETEKTGRVLHARDASVAEFGACAQDVFKPYSLVPQWNTRELEWLFGLARQKNRNGPLHMQIALQENGDVAGVYAFYGRSGGVAQVLNVLPLAGQQDALVRLLLQQAAAMGCVAVRGAVHPLYAEGLYRVPDIFYRHNSATVVRTLHKELAQAIAEGKAFFGGLTGEGWTRLVSDRF